MDDFLIRAGLAGVAVALAAGPLGSFVIWRRMAFFGDATAHAAILGVALALAMSLPVGIGIFAVALAMGILLAQLMARGHSADATLGVLSHSALAIGLLVFSFLRGTRVSLDSFLFGDILTVRWSEVWVIWGGAVAVLALLIWRWSRLLTATLNPDLAASAGISAAREQGWLTLALALLVAMAIKIVGALLIAALLIIPAAAARMHSRTPEAMATLAGLVAILAVIGGLGLSILMDSPAGPTIVSTAALAYAILAVADALRRRFRA